MNVVKKWKIYSRVTKIIDKYHQFQIFMRYMRMSANPQGQPVPTEEQSSRRFPPTCDSIYKLLQQTYNLLKWTSSYIWSDWPILLGNICYIAIVLTLARTAKMDTFGHQAFRTFDLSDKSLSYKHVKSRISGNQNIIFTIVWSWCICWFVNLFDRKQRKLSKEITPKHFGLCSRVRVGIYRGIWSSIFLIIAAAETNLLTNMTKTLVGVPKPHFLMECNPDLSLLPAGETYVNETLTVTICKNKDNDYRRSFPSGHASQVENLFIGKRLSSL